MKPMKIAFLTNPDRARNQQLSAIKRWNLSSKDFLNMSRIGWKSWRWPSSKNRRRRWMALHLSQYWWVSNYLLASLTSTSQCLRQHSFRCSQHLSGPPTASTSVPSLKFSTDYTSTNKNIKTWGMKKPGNILRNNLMGFLLHKLITVKRL